jgi:AraC-like DNA-binding protein
MDALRLDAAIRDCTRFSEVRTLVETGLASIVVADHRDVDGGSTLPGIKRLRDDFPSVPIVMYVPLSNEISGLVLEYARAGVSQLVFQGVDDLRTPLRAAVNAALDHASARATGAELAGLVPTNLLPFFLYCLEHARRDIGVEEVAAAMGVHRKTLVDRLRAAALPSPRAIIAWSRLLVASRLLDDPGRTVEQAAMMLDFPSGTALRNMFKRYTGLRTSEVRQNGGVRCVLHAYKRQLATVGAPPAGS